MRRPVVVDTNVGVVANGRADQAGPDCVLACVEALELVVSQGRLLVDDGMRIIREYQDNLSPSGAPGVGDRFLKWIWQNYSNDTVCSQVSVTEDAERGFEEFPDDPSLVGFDVSDRKFVAVALASGVRAPILNSSDTDWWDYRTELAGHGIDIHFLCPELMNGDE
jgi:hypothetical protein